MSTLNMVLDNMKLLVIIKHMNNNTTYPTISDISSVSVKVTFSEHVPLNRVKGQELTVAEANKLINAATVAINAADAGYCKTDLAVTFTYESGESDTIELANLQVGYGTTRSLKNVEKAIMHWVNLYDLDADWDQCHKSQCLRRLTQWALSSTHS